MPLKLAPLFLSFRKKKKKKTSSNIHTLHSQPTVAGCHYEESSSFIIFLDPIPIHLATEAQKSQSIHGHHFLRVSNKLSESPCFRNRFS